MCFLLASQYPRAPHSGAQAFPAFLFVPLVHQAAKEGLSPLQRTPELWFPACGSTCLLPRVSVHPHYFPLPLRSFLGAEVSAQCFFPSYPTTWESFLQPWSYSCSSSFQFVFSENFSTCRCIFHVLLGVGELHILLLHLFNPPFQCNIWNQYKKLFLTQKLNTKDWKWKKVKSL